MLFPPNSKLPLCDNINGGEQKSTFYCTYYSTGLAAWHKIATVSITNYINTYINCPFSEGKVKNTALHQLFSSTEVNFLQKGRFSNILWVNERSELSTLQFIGSLHNQVGRQLQADTQVVKDRFRLF